MKPKTVTSKSLTVGNYTLHSVHYHPADYSEINYGWLIGRKRGLFDIYFGKHIFAFVLIRNWYPKGIDPWKTEIEQTKRV